MVHILDGSSGYDAQYSVCQSVKAFVYIDSRSNYLSIPVFI